MRNLPHPLGSNSCGKARHIIQTININEHTFCSVLEEYCFSTPWAFDASAFHPLSEHVLIAGGPLDTVLYYPLPPLCYGLF